MDATKQDVLALSMAIDLATENVRNSGGPFGALVVAADGRVFEGTNRVTANLDPTAHAEVSAIRAACQGLGTFDLSGATLYSSCEPCPMCRAAALWARIGTVCFAADRHDAADAGFDDAAFYEYFEHPADENSLMPIVRIDLEREEALRPFTIWTKTATRIRY
ncbi:nucleoside deaminase [Cryobacterium psychrophilum]|uniref:Nucleoside deaminase n=1 Tax=Cryobacterium psychrophilum TaxID=41988 RepID=A0A4Y8KLP7_9MICO|nr:nucleoside deaminase [Cryobacterium psychrophilum]TDW30186.1 guanine deaminase [Cryobacterium psychrophilum]TFD77414.1 nucleoside deaminase [Cryobacterium psychrophilum]